MHDAHKRPWVGEISIGGAYYYGESDWDTGASRGDNLSENVIRDGYLGKFTVGLHPDLEVFVKAGKESIQKGSHSSLSSDNDDFFSVGPSSIFENEWIPNVDIEEDAKAIHVKAEMPGIEEKDLSVSIENNTLCISGEKKEERREENRDRRYLKRQRP